MNDNISPKVRNLFSILTIMLIAGVIFSQQKVLIDKVVAQVGGEIILLSDVETEFQFYKSQNKNVEDNTKCLILEQIMAQKLLISQAKIDSIEVSDDMVETQLDLRMQGVLRRMGGDEDLFRQYYGKTVAEMKTIYREDIRNNLLAEMMQQKLIDNIDITPSEVIEFFNSIPADSLPYFNSEVEISQIIISPKVSEAERIKAFEKIRDIKSRLDNEESFEDLAKRFSDDPGSALRGGNLGWVQRGNFVPRFEAAAYTMKKGEISDIVETEYGFHIIQLLERRGNTINTRHILVKPSLTTEDMKRAESKLDSLRNLILADSISFEQAVKKFSDPKSASYSNNGRMTNSMNQTTFFEMNELQPDVYFSIERLNEGQISEVMETINEMGETRFQILKLLTKTEPHRANLRQDYSRIQMFAKNSKKNEYINKWVENKISSAFLFVEPDFKESCQNINQWFELTN